jgi:glycosyltransferase involved in cell wall biosynthesis
VTYPFQALPRRHGKTPVILQIIPELGPGGAEQGTIDMAYGINAAGGRAIVVSHGGSKTRLQELSRTGAVHIDLPVDSKNPLTLWGNISRLKKICVEHQVDIIHARSRAPAWSAMRVAHSLHIPFITTCHAPYQVGGRLKRFYNSVMAKGDRVIAISHYVADYLRREYGTDDTRIRLVHRGVAMDKFHPTMVTPDRLIRAANEWRVPDGATIIMLPGRLTAWKGHHVLIDAVAKLNHPDIFLAFVGSDQGRADYVAELRDHIERVGLNGRVRFTGDYHDFAAAYMLSHIIVSASIEPEGFGRVAIEAQAMGRLVIATDHGGSRETIVHGQTGWLVPPNDPNALANALERVLNLDASERAQIGTAAMEHIAQHFTREQMIAKTLDVYREVL